MRKGSTEVAKRTAKVTTARKSKEKTAAKCITTRRSKASQTQTNATEQDYLSELRKECTLTEWRLICRKAVEDAKEGDARARQWLNDYLVGKPRDDDDNGKETAESFAKSILDSVREMSGKTEGSKGRAATSIAGSGVKEITSGNAKMDEDQGV